MGCMGFVNLFSGAVAGRKQFLCLLAAAVLSWPVLAQQAVHSVPRTGLSAGFGNQVLLGKPYRYQVYLFHVSHQRPLWKKGATAVEMIFMAQVNPTRFKKEDSQPDFISGLEYGVNAGALIRRPAFRNRHSIYGMISSGPHYVTDAPVRQKEGFLFCNYFAAGLTLCDKQRVPVDLRLGVRHISNLGIKEPNGGINNLFVAVTVYPF